MQKYYILILTVIFTQHVFSQIQYEGKPYSFDYKSDLSTIQSIEMPEIDVQKLLEEDKEISPIRFAKDFVVNYNLNNSGTWDKLGNGDRIWRLKIKSNNALTLNFIFNRFLLPKHTKLYIYNENKSEILGAFTNENCIPSAKFATSIINGDVAIIEYNIPHNVTETGEVELLKINHGYKEVFFDLKDDRFGLSGDCNVDVNCAEGYNWKKEKHAVCRIIMGGTQLCTGALINNVNNDGTPYFLTANHCTTAPYDEWVFYFNYESPTCGGEDGSTGQTISACELRATSGNLDFCLVEMSSAPPKAYHPYYVGWNHTIIPAQNTTGIHHPMGDVKKISIDNDSPIIADYGNGYDTESHWKIGEWNVGTTEGGSSGSPLFDENHRLIGDLTGGEAACGNSVNDYYTRFDLSWDTYSESSQQLKYWLDPQNIGVDTIDGYDPYMSVYSFECDTSSNTNDGENIKAYDFNTVWGYWSGHNEYGFSKFADAYETTNTQYVQGIRLPILRAYSGNTDSHITVKIWDDNGGIPGNELASKNVLISEFSEGMWKYIEFNSYVEVQGKYYVGYEIYYNTPVDTFVVHMVEDRGESGINTALTYYNNQWRFYNDISSLHTSLAIEVLICTITGEEDILETSTSEVNIYPNPMQSKFYIKTNFEKFDVIIYDIFGRVVKHENNYRNIGIDCSNLSNGIYLVEINDKKNRIIEKIFITH